MSRIEEALEKAVQIRQTVGESTPSEGVSRGKDSSSPVFQSIPPVINTSTVNPHIVCLTDPYSPAAEQYKKLRAQILKNTRAKFLNSIAITSSQAGEGKTLTAINLAITMAQEIDYTVLLVDADLRKPSIHTYLGIEAKYGLSDYLQGNAKLNDILINTGIGKLVLLPAGQPPSNPSELLSSNRMNELVKEMKSRYKDRYIIFDSTPVLVSSDAMALCGCVDAILLVVQAAQTSEKSVKKTVNLIKGTPILGVVYNNVPDYMSKDVHSYPYNYEASMTTAQHQTPLNEAEK